MNTVVNDKSIVYGDDRHHLRSVSVPTEEEYGERGKRLLRALMVGKGVSYEQLAERLTALGMPETAVNLRNKVSRGKFTAAFLLATCEALSVGTLKLEND